MVRLPSVTTPSSRSLDPRRRNLSCQWEKSGPARQNSWAPHWFPGIRCQISSPVRAPYRQRVAPTATSPGIASTRLVSGLMLITPRAGRRASAACHEMRFLSWSFFMGVAMNLPQCHDWGAVAGRRRSEPSCRWWFFWGYAPRPVTASYISNRWRVLTFAEGGDRPLLS